MATIIRGGNSIGTRLLLLLKRSSSIATGAFLSELLDPLDDLRTTTGRTSVNALKVPGVDALPGTSTWNAGTRTVTLLGQIATVADWDFRDTTIYVGANAVIGSISQCLFGEEASGRGFSFYINGDVTAWIKLITRCSFKGAGGAYPSAGAAINCALSSNTGGTGVTALRIDLIERSLFDALYTDGIKAAGSLHRNGQRIENCYFSPPQNLPNTPTPYDTVTTYALNFAIYDATDGYKYLSKVAGNINNPLPAKTGGTPKLNSNTWWQGVDPHGDAITHTASINRTTVRNCLFDWGTRKRGSANVGNQAGLNNFARLVRNTNSDNIVGPILYESCKAYTGSAYSSYPLQVDSGLPSPPANFNGPIIFRDIKAEGNSLNALFHPSSNGLTAYWINVRNLRNVVWAAPTGAITTDAAAAPVNSVAPVPSGSAISGATLTTTLGIFTGFPTPFTDIKWQRSANGTTGWTDIAGSDNSLTYLLVGADEGQYVRSAVMAYNSSSAGVWAYSAATAQIAAGYVQKTYATNGTANIAITPGGTATKFELSMWVKPVLSVISRFLRRASSVDIYTATNGTLNVLFFDSAGTAIYTATSPAGTISAASKQHLYVSANWTTQTVVVRVNGVAITMTPTVGPIAGTSSLRPNFAHEIMWTGTTVMTADFSDYYLAYHSGNLQGYAAFWNGGTPPDLAPIVAAQAAAGIGSPQLRLGGAQTAANLNAGQNLGSGTITVTTGTFTDV
jgi:hypothetical protein